jgi:methane monooxygenase PmoA-like
MMAAAELEQQADRLVARAGDRVLFEYVFKPELPPVLSPRPYFHPVRTLGGVVITDHQPADHRWHLGISYAWPVVSGLNFWGGPTFVRGEGYQQLDNNGQTRHLDWNGREEHLEWLDPKGVRIATERRRLGVPEVATDASSWSLALETEIENSGPQVVRFGSPTTEGRPMAGYAGLSWRGPEALRFAVVLLEGRPTPARMPQPVHVPEDRWHAAAQDEMGSHALWLALAGGGATVAVAEHPDNPGVPNRWFVRTDVYPLVTSSPVFDHYLELEPGETLRLRHRLLVADGEWSGERLAGELRWDA